MSRVIETRSDLVRRLLSLAYELHHEADSYEQTVLNDEIQLLMVCYNVPAMAIDYIKRHAMELHDHPACHESRNLINRIETAAERMTGMGGIAWLG